MLHGDLVPTYSTIYSAVSQAALCKSVISSMRNFSVISEIWNVNPGQLGIVINVQRSHHVLARAILICFRRVLHYMFHYSTSTALQEVPPN